MSRPVFILLPYYVYTYSNHIYYIYVQVHENELHALKGGWCALCVRTCMYNVGHM